MLFAPLLLFLAGGAYGAYQSIRNAPAADAFRATPPCAPGERSASIRCFVLSPASVRAVTWSRGRSPIVRQDVTLRLLDGDHSVHLDVWIWQLRAIRPGEQVQVRLDQGNVTEIAAGGTTYETTDSQVAASTTPRDVAIGFGVLALLVAVIMALAGRGQWFGLIRGSWDVLRPNPAGAARDRLVSLAPGGSVNLPGLGASVVQPDRIDKQALLNRYATAAPLDPNEPGRQVIRPSVSQRRYGIGVGVLLGACALAGVTYVQTVPVEFMAACLAICGVVLVWWALSWKLILTSTGFEVVGMVTRKRRRWVDVSGFDVDVSDAGRGTRYVVHFRDSPSFTVGTIESKGRFRWMLGLMGNSFSPRGMSAQEQVNLLEEWRRRYS